ncbi:chromosome-anchoring protein RacA [Bacillus solitudinis]|uniref:chromosome-anchoring protein RacA n=1 Tax=Bacillus solitudinis TaxID=2014074 RepID=UPI000C23E833|nr:chromosome-anchoring protein RacA [Bacillus solitudinis]
MMKSSQNSNELGINPTTIKRWTTYFGIQCQVDEYGYQYFSQQQIKALLSIQKQLQEGKRMREVDLTEFQGIANQADPTMVDTRKYDQKLGEVITRVTDLEHQLSRKADEVVSYQLLKHRAELEEMYQNLQKLEKRLGNIENKVPQSTFNLSDHLPLVAGGEVKKKRRSLMQMFSF